MKDWAFITSHGFVLSYIAHRSQATAREMALALGITERRVVKIIGDLHAAGYISKKRVGNRNVYTVNMELSLRHPEQRDRMIGELLTLVAPPGSETAEDKKDSLQIEMVLNDAQ